VKKVHAWGINRDFEKVMYAILLLMGVTLTIMETVMFRKRDNTSSKK
jgi:hypothetical protein